MAGRESADKVTLIGLDRTRSGRRWRRLKFIQGDLRHAATVELIRRAEPDLVLHFAVRVASAAAQPRAAHDTNVIGTMNLLAGCRGVRRLVVESSVVIYPASSEGPSVLREEDALLRPAGSRSAADLREIENLLTDYAVANPGQSISVLRFGPILGPRWRGSLADYLRLPSPPTVPGYDPRLQLLGAADAVEATRLAASAGHPGVFNVAGKGTLLLSQLLKLGGRSSRPALPPLIGSFLQAQSYRILTRTPHPPAHFMEFLSSGQVVDTGRFEREFGWHPVQSSREVAAAFFGPNPQPGPGTRPGSRR